MHWVITLFRGSPPSLVHETIAAVISLLVLVIVFRKRTVQAQEVIVTKQGGVLVTIIALAVVGYLYFFRKPEVKAAPAQHVTITRHPVVLSSPLSGWEIIVAIVIVAILTLGIIAMNRYPRR